MIDTTHNPSWHWAQVGFIAGVIFVPQTADTPAHDISFNSGFTGVPGFLSEAFVGGLLFAILFGLGAWGIRQLGKWFETLPTDDFQ